MADSEKGCRSYRIEGFEVLVGKTQQDNDTLSLKLAKPQDFWFHVAGYAGSHVVVANPEGRSEERRVGKEC